MNETTSMDASGRLVLPKAIRRRLNLSNGATLRVDVVAGRIELTPIENAGSAQLTRKGGIMVLKRTGTKTETAAAVSEEREAQAERGLRR